MKDNNFEQIWRDAIANADLQAPKEVWHKIETDLDKSSSPVFEEELMEVFQDSTLNVSPSVWKQLSDELDREEILSKFQDASIAPPLEVWDKIEAALEEEDEKPIIIFFTQRRLIAGLAAMLILALGIPLFNSFYNSVNPKASAKQETPSSKKEVYDQNVAKVFGDRNEKSPVTSSIIKKTISANTLDLASNNLFSIVPNNEAQQKEVIQVEEKTNIVNELVALFKDKLEKLEIREFSKYGNRFTFNKNRLSFHYTKEELEELEKPKKERWLGFMSGLSPFDPNISISNFERQALASAGGVQPNLFEYKSVVDNGVLAAGNPNFEIPLSQPFNNVRDGSAINVGLDYGFKMARRVSVQTGARYSRGSSFIQSNVYNFNEKSGDVSSFLESNYLAKGNSDRVYNNTLISTTADIKNAYQFIMIPVSVAYEIPIINKLDVAVSGGISGDFLINNILDEVAEGGSKLTPSNSAYRGMNVSALGGLKFKYNVNSNWDASLGMNFQQALRSGVDASQNFTFVPRYIGVNYGVNYKF